MYTLTAADFADTGQWRLVLKIMRRGMEAWLENTLHNEIPQQQLCSAEWEEDDVKLLSNFENAVFDNPRLLDDFATKIIIYDIKTLFIPSDIPELTDKSETDIYKNFYDGATADIMSDRDGEITAAWTMVPGLRSFLLRTFPGARITCNLMEKVRSLRKSNKGILLFGEVRDSETDIILLENNKLKAASTRKTKKDTNQESMFREVAEAYGYSYSTINKQIEYNEDNKR